MQSHWQLVMEVQLQYTSHAHAHASCTTCACMRRTCTIPLRVGGWPQTALHTLATLDIRYNRKLPPPRLYHYSQQPPIWSDIQLRKVSSSAAKPPEGRAPASAHRQKMAVAREKRGLNPIKAAAKAQRERPQERQAIPANDGAHGRRCKKLM